MSQLIETYKGVLKAMDLTVKDDGSVFKKEDRYFIKGKPLYVPLQSVLGSADVSDKIIFHPLGEAAAKGESDVVEDMRLQMVARLNAQVAKFINFFSMLGVGAVKANLDPEQSKILSVIKDVTEKEQRDYLQLFRATTRGEGKKTPLIKIYLSRVNGSADGKKFTRKAVVTFPLYALAKKELESKEKSHTLLGVTLSKKGVQSLVRMMEFIFPSIAEEGAYNQGGFSVIAPFCDALFRAVGGMVATLNEKSELFETVDDTCPAAMSENWADVVDVLDSLFNEISMIPVQPNADGKARVSDLQNASLSVAAPAAPAVNAAPVHAVPHQAQQPQFAVPASPQVHPSHYAQPAPQPQYQQPQAIPEFITNPDGSVRRNPAFSQMVAYPGHGMPQQRAADPWTTAPMLPSNSGQISYQQMQYTQPGGLVGAQPHGGYYPQHQQGGMAYPQPGMNGGYPNNMSGFYR